MIEWLLIGLLAGLVAGLGVALLSQRKVVGSQVAQIMELQADLRHANAGKAEVQEWMIQQVIMMRQQGFQTIPEDEKFDTYRITPDLEAEWEQDRFQGVGGIQPQSIVEGE